MGPLKGIKIIEIGSIGPGPFCAMMLADMGAEVIRVDRKAGEDKGLRFDVLQRGRRSMAINLKQREGVDTVHRMIDRADALIEGFRPGVMERLGLGPEECLKRNPRLIFGRMTGWGQSGPLSQLAGHDINYIAISGALHAIGRPEEPPVIPINLVGDFGGGGMLLAFGIVCGILEARQSGKGQVVDAAMSDGAALLMAPFYGMKAAGQWNNQRGTNLLDGGAHFYNTYECADGKWIAVGSLEPQFYALLLQKAGISDPSFQAQMDASRWPELKAKFAAIFKSKSRDEWCALFEKSDSCVAPILDFDEAPQHPHNAARGTFVKIGDVMQPAPAPRFSRTAPETPRAPSPPGQETCEILADWGFTTSEIAHLKNTGAI